MNKTNWTEIVIPVTKEYIDPVSNFLIEEGSKGVVEEVSNLNNEITLLKIYFENNKNLEPILTNIKRYIKELYELNGRFDTPEIYTNQLPDEDWGNKWKKFFKPIKVTERIIIKPSWEKYEKNENEIVVEIDPAMAFGTGNHQSTRLCIKAIDELAQSLHEKGNLLDVGTGSGILAIVSALLGFKNIVGIDIDNLAIETSKENAKINLVSDKIEFFQKPIEEIKGKFSVIVANIMADTLISMKKELIRLLNDKGILILSGIVIERREDVIKTFSQYIKFVKEIREEEWVCLVFSR